jgi:peptide/nickel transport system permease protein
MSIQLLKTRGFYLLLVFIIIAIFADVFSPYEPGQRFEPYTPPGADHLLGTNDLGNDILSELIQGTRISLLVGFVTAIISTFWGVLVGMLAGYYKGIVDEGLMGLTDIFLMIPRIPLLIVLAAFIQPGPWTIALLLGLLWWPSTARVIRSNTLQVRETAFIKSAECIGFSRLRIMFYEILPNMLQVVLAKFLISFASAMIAEASISFLGLGDPLLKSWGMMLNTAFNEGGLINAMWWWYIPPGLCITLVVIAVMFTGLSLEQYSTKPKKEILFT